LVARDRQAFERVAASAVPRLRELLGGVKIEASSHDAFEVEDGQKFQALVPLA
jgi:hypothetical protein